MIHGNRNFDQDIISRLIDLAVYQQTLIFLPKKHPGGKDDISDTTSNGSGFGPTFLNRYPSLPNFKRPTHDTKLCWTEGGWFMRFGEDQWIPMDRYKKQRRTIAKYESSRGFLIFREHVRNISHYRHNLS